VLRLIGARKAREAQLEYLANHDELTGHYNRGRLREALEHALGAARRYGIAGAYLVVGIDRLAPIGDAFGIEAADAIVIAIGRVLDRSLRNTDIIGRIGPDRFGVVLSHSPVVDLAITAEKILAAVRLARIEAQGSELHVTVSIGGVAFQENAPAVADIMGRGETALHVAEQQGRDCFALYQDGPTHREQRRHAMWVVEEVQSGLKDGRVMLAYQPIVDSVTRRPDHYECLIRLRRRNGQVVTAANFVPLVEQSGLMRQVDRRAVELAIEELSAFPDLRLAVNVSGHTTSDRNWLRTLATLVRGIPEVAQRLTVEITETVALQDIDETARFVRKLRDLGCRVSLDDFGAGYTSFRNLKALEVDCVKIDGSFVRGLSENIDNQLFVRTLIGLADGLGLFTVAECVESEEDSALLARRGVRFMQGWHFGKPSLERPWLPESGAATSSPAASATPKLTVVNGGRAALRGV
jgi:diguanylate cyclase (GGDEF)-like protein